MADIAPALARLQLAIDQSDGLQRGLRHRQEDLLSLEMSVRDMTANRTTGRVVIDQAEDIRRVIKGHTTDQLAEIREALSRTDTVVVSAAVERSMPADFARLLGDLVNSAGEEARRGTMDLPNVDQALSRVSRALPGEPRLAQSAQESIDRSAGRLESARRAVFRVVQDLPVITRAIHEVRGSDPAEPRRDIETQPNPTDLTLGAAAERRQPPHRVVPVDEAMRR